MDRLLFLDTETTGLTAAKIVTISYNLGEELMFSHGVFKPDKPIEDGAAAIHGFTTESVRGCPIFQGSIDHAKLQKLLDERVLICHNVKFDKEVLENEGFKIGKHLCTVDVARHFYPKLPNHKLATLKEALNLNPPGAIAHSALGDTMVLKALFLKTCHEEVSESQSTVEYILAKFTR